MKVNLCKVSINVSIKPVNIDVGVVNVTWNSMSFIIVWNCAKKGKFESVFVQCIVIILMHGNSFSQKSISAEFY